MTLGQPVFDALEPKFTPLQVCPVRGVDLLNCDGCCYSLKLCTMHKPEKVGTVSLSSDNSGYDLASGAMQFSYNIPHVFRYCNIPVLTIVISTQCHAKKLEIKKNSFTNCHNIGLVMKVK